MVIKLCCWSDHELGGYLLLSANDSGWQTSVWLSKLLMLQKATCLVPDDVGMIVDAPSL
jgi:hypothetical protein